MKKQILMVLLMLFTMSTVDVSAQNFLKKIGKAVEKEVKNKVEKEIDKRVKKSTKQQNQTAQENTQSASAKSKSTQQEAPVIASLMERGPLTGKVGTHQWVDMGLPSGTRWATCNVDATKPEQRGKHYAWGEIATKATYTQENSKYHRKDIADFSGDKAYDVATAKWGKGWRMPTREEFDELFYYCDWKYVQRGGVWGSEFTSPTTKNTIFLPCAGFKDGAKHELASGNGLYWTSTPQRDGYYNGAYMYQFGGGLGEISAGERSYGYTIRPVTDYDVDVQTSVSGEIAGHKYVDMGLPSGLKWATCNLGADAPDRSGQYYAWGEVSHILDKEAVQNKMDGKKVGDISGNPKYDAARKVWGSTWRIPTQAEFEELMDNCTIEYTQLARRNGLKITSKTNGNYIFLPIAGTMVAHTDRPNKEDRSVGYWASTPRNSDGYDAYYFSVFDRKYMLASSMRYTGLLIRPVSE